MVGGRHGRILVGDLVPVKVAEGVVITDTVKEAAMEWVAPKYVRVTPSIGEQSDPDSREQKQVAALKESQRREERSK